MEEECANPQYHLKKKKEAAKLAAKNDKSSQPKASQDESRKELTNNKEFKAIIDYLHAYTSYSLHGKAFLKILKTKINIDNLLILYYYNFSFSIVYYLKVWFAAFEVNLKKKSVTVTGSPEFPLIETSNLTYVGN